MPFSGSFSSLSFSSSLSYLSHYCLILSFTLLSFSLGLIFFSCFISHLYIIFLRFALTLSHEFLVSLYRLFLILIFFVSCIYHLSHLFSFFTSSFSCLSHYGLMLPFRLLTFFLCLIFFSCFIFLSSVSHLAHDYTSYTYSHLCSNFLLSLFLLLHLDLLPFMSFPFAFLIPVSSLMFAWTLFVSCPLFITLSHLFNFVFCLITFSSVSHLSHHHLMSQSLNYPISYLFIFHILIFFICFVLLYAVFLILVSWFCLISFSSSFFSAKTFSFALTLSLLSHHCLTSLLTLSSVSSLSPLRLTSLSSSPHICLIISVFSISFFCFSISFSLLLSSCHLFSFLSLSLLILPHLFLIFFFSHSKLSLY